jgi:hypothetical protein
MIIIIFVSAISVARNYLTSETRYYRRFRYLLRTYLHLLSFKMTFRLISMILVHVIIMRLLRRRKDKKSGLQTVSRLLKGFSGYYLSCTECCGFEPPIWLLVTCQVGFLLGCLVFFLDSYMLC